MSVNLTVPQLGESITEAIVGKWHKKVGDAVKTDEPVVVLETDKVTIDVPAPANGAIAQIKFKEGDKVRIGEVLGTITEGAGASPSAPAAEAPKAAAGNGSTGGSKEAERTPPVSPTAEQLAKQNDVDLATVKGTGHGGRVTKEDVLAAIESKKAGGQSIAVQKFTASVTPPAATSTPAPAAAKAPRSTTEREERVKMTPLRRRVAARLKESQNTAAILTTFNEVDMGEVMALRKKYNEQFQKKHGVKLGFMSFFVRATIEALKAFPQINAEIDGEDVIFKHYYDIGVAVSGSRGLVVPVLRDADSLSMAEIEKNIADLGVRAKTDKLSLGELQGGTFSITNGGIFGSMLSTPILNPPQTGILGMHNIVERPVARDGQVVIRPIMYVALSYDHRLVDGREAVQFLVRIKECIESPERLLLEI